MEYVRIDPLRPEPDAIRRAADTIAAGGVVGYPTDTLYGLAVDPRSAVAVERLFALKERPADRAIPLIAADIEAARAAVDWPPAATRLAEACWPGPLTLVMIARPGLAAEICGAGGSVGIRVPDSPVARALAAAAGGLITATSANTSGEPATSDPAVAARLGPRGLDLLIDAGPSPGGAPSTIVDVTGTVPRLVRAGAVSWERVLEFLGPHPPC